MSQAAVRVAPGAVWAAGAVVGASNRPPSRDDQTLEVIIHGAPSCGMSNAVRAGQLYGFRRMSLGDDGDIETEFFVNKRAFERVLCDGQNPVIVKARLREAGWLKPGQDGRDTRNVCTPLGRQWCFVLNKNALSGAI